jgi:hypothetical protein
VKEKFVRYIGLAIALVIILIGYDTDHFYFAWLGVSVAVLSSLLADILK